MKATNYFGKWTISGWLLVIVVIIVVYNSTMCLIIILSLNIWPLDLVSSLYEFVRACKFTGEMSMGKNLPCNSYKIITPQEIKYQPTKNEIPRYLIWGGRRRKRNIDDRQTLTSGSKAYFHLLWLYKEICIYHRMIYPCQACGCVMYFSDSHWGNIPK